MNKKHTSIRWVFSEEKILIDNYHTKTIFEIMELLPNKTQESINCKIKRLKAAGKITSGKDDDTKVRAYKQRDDNE